MISDIHRTVVKGHDAQSVSDSRSMNHRMAAHCRLDSSQVSDLGHKWANFLTSEPSIPGESPPLPPRTFFGRDELIEKIVDLAKNFTPVALIGAGGIGKTSIALNVLHHDRIKQRFGHDRRFIRCDQFPTSLAHFLRRLSSVIGAGVENPEDLTPLRAFLSSKEMVIVLDNAESILDPLGTDAQEIYAVVEELSRSSNTWICITSRISTTPPDYKRLDTPTLSMDAARDTFYQIYDSDSRSDQVNGILEQLDFHPLSITLFATVAHQNKWDTSRLISEWERRRTSVLQTQHNKSLAAAIELSLTSPMFQELGPDARGLLGVVAFFPQGIDENNLGGFFPTISDRTDIFDKFCILSLTYRNNGFVTMLAPLRDYLSPKDPKSSSLLCTVKELYFACLSINLDPNGPYFGEARWIVSEDTNVEHLLDIFTTVDANSDSVWDACFNFMNHLYWHKQRLIVLGSKIEGLPDNHHSKPKCLYGFARLLGRVGNWAECKRLLIHALKLWREQGDDDWVAQVSMMLSEISRVMDLPKEGIPLAKEALEIYERLGDLGRQVDCLTRLAYLLNNDEQLDAAEDAVSRAIDLLPEEGEQFRVCKAHRVLGLIYRSKGETEKAIHHFEVVLGIATSFDWHGDLFVVHQDLAELFIDECRLDDAQTRIEHAKSHAVDSPYNLGRLMVSQAEVWYKQDKLEEARSEVLRAAEVFERLGATTDLETCREFLKAMERSEWYGRLWSIVSSYEQRRFLPH